MKPPIEAYKLFMENKISTSELFNMLITRYKLKPINAIGLVNRMRHRMKLPGVQYYNSSNGDRMLASAVIVTAIIDYKRYCKLLLNQERIKCPIKKAELELHGKEAESFLFSSQPMWRSGRKQWCNVLNFSLSVFERKIQEAKSTNFERIKSFDKTIGTRRHNNNASANNGC